MSNAPMSRPSTGGGSGALKIVGITVGVILLIIIGSGIGVFSAINSNQKHAVQLETALSAQYLDNQNELSSYISTINETLGVADRASAKANGIIVNAIKGRYQNGSSAKPTGGAFFSAIKEAYPDIHWTTALYAKVQDAVIAGRQAYKDKQSKLLDMLRNYDSWRNAGI